MHWLAKLRVRMGYYDLPWEWRVFNWVRG